MTPEAVNLDRIIGRAIPASKPPVDAGRLAAGVERGLAGVERAERPFHPVDGDVDYGSIEAAFGNARGRPHEGQDMFAPTGTPLISPTGTAVLETGVDGGRGNWAAIHDPERDLTYVYFHMASAAEVSAGQRLEPGDRVGRVGCTGSCYGEHLHFEVRLGANPYGAATDPMPYLTRWARFRG